MLYSLFQTPDMPVQSLAHRPHYKCHVFQIKKLNLNLDRGTVRPNFFVHTDIWNRSRRYWDLRLKAIFLSYFIEFDNA